MRRRPVASFRHGEVQLEATDGASACRVCDWESLLRVAESTAVGFAAATWNFVGAPEEPLAPAASEIRRFVEAYQAARGRGFTLAERDGAHAAAVYGLAYAARCEHALARASRPGVPRVGCATVA